MGVIGLKARDLRARISSPLHKSWSRRPRSRRYDEGASEDDVRSSRDKFRQQTFFIIIDTLIAELNRRMSAYSSIAEQFAVFRECLDQEGKCNRVAAQRGFTCGCV